MAALENCNGIDKIDTVRTTKVGYSTIKYGTKVTSLDDLVDKWFQ